METNREKESRNIASCGTRKRTNANKPYKGVREILKETGPSGHQSTVRQHPRSYDFMDKAASPNRNAVNGQKRMQRAHKGKKTARIVALSNVFVDYGRCRSH